MNFKKNLIKIAAISFTFTLIFTLSSCAPQKQGEPTEVKPAPKEIKTQPAEIKPQPTETKTQPTETKPQQTEIKPQPTPVKLPQEVVLSMKFVKGQTDKYKSIMETERSGEFTGEIAKDQQFKNAKSGTRAEMVFTQQVDIIDQSGNATEKITIEALRYVSKQRDVVNIDFNSLNSQSQASPLNKLIGQSYSITISAKGEVIGISGLDNLRRLVNTANPENNAASLLVSDNLIRRRHQIPPLIDANERKFKIGDKWSVTKTVNFGIMGDNTFEKIYTLKEIDTKGNNLDAVVEITGIPPTTQTNVTSPLTKMFDTNNSYTGSFIFNLTGSKLEQYSEKMTSDWTVADTKSTQGEPSTIKLGTMELTSLQRLD